MSPLASLAKPAARAVALFAFGYLPLAGVVGIIEGAAYGRWGLSLHDWQYQLGGYAAFMLPWLAPSGVLAAPLTLVLLRAVHVRAPARRRLWVGVCGPIAVVSSAALVLGISGGAWWAAPLMLGALPVTFLGGAAAFAALCARYALPTSQPPKELAV
jgi:hypothetical protein